MNSIHVIEGIPLPLAVIVASSASDEYGEHRRFSVSDRIIALDALNNDLDFEATVSLVEKVSHCSEDLKELFLHPRIRIDIRHATTGETLLHRYQSILSVVISVHKTGRSDDVVPFRTLLVQMLSERDSKGQTPLMKMICRNRSSEELCDIFLSLSRDLCDPDARDNDNRSPLMMLCTRPSSSNTVRLVQKFLHRNDVDVMARDVDGNTPFLKAVDKAAASKPCHSGLPRFDVIHLILDAVESRGIIPEDRLFANAKGKTPIISAIQADDEELLLVLCDRLGFA